MTEIRNRLYVLVALVLLPAAGAILGGCGSYAVGHGARNSQASILTKAGHLAPRGCDFLLHPKNPDLIEFLLDGDRVDVILTADVRKNGGVFRTHAIILENIEVRSLRWETELGSRESSGKVMVLTVTSRQLTSMVNARERGGALSLALRPAVPQGGGAGTNESRRLPRVRVVPTQEPFGEILCVSIRGE